MYVQRIRRVRGLARLVRTARNRARTETFSLVNQSCSYFPSLLLPSREPRVQKTLIFFNRSPFRPSPRFGESRRPTASGVRAMGEQRKPRRRRCRLHDDARYHIPESCEPFWLSANGFGAAHLHTRRRWRLRLDRTALFCENKIRGPVHGRRIFFLLNFVVCAAFTAGRKRNGRAPRSP